MDQPQYTTLVEAVRMVPDLRKRRGQRYPWWMLVTLLAAAVVSGQRQRHGRAISQWGHEHVDERADVLAPAGGRVPSQATLRRTVQAVDVVALDTCLSALHRPAPRPATGLVGGAVDGKAVRRLHPHGRTLHLVSIVRHDGIVLGQTAVADKENEIVAAPALLRGHDLRGGVVTVDALLTQRSLARPIRQQGGHYLMVVKDNQEDRGHALRTLFTQWPWLVYEHGREVWQTRAVAKGHGRLETRTLAASTTLND